MNKNIRIRHALLLCYIYKEIILLYQNNLFPVSFLFSLFARTPKLVFERGSSNKSILEFWLPTYWLSKIIVEVFFSKGVVTHAWSFMMPASR